MMRFAALLAWLCLLVVPCGTARAQDGDLSIAANQAFLANNARQPGVVIRPSGLQYKIIKSGYGKRPGPRDTVSCYYKGQLINGKVFDATEPGFPAQFVVNQLIPGWTEALELMREGDRWQLVVPSNLAYGERGAGDGNIPPNQTLVFDLEVLSVTPAPEEKPGDKDQSPGGSGAQDE
ncbi:MAG TPA: FKBP-type peptidyl-prolyl cis-trans isomerase [Rhizomicrobium sp.]|nr:FKBP-type peptidyl-prolyl cis-trans isomerase [Rhizomicrobium sp.]